MRSMIKDPDRALVGVATVFNQRSRNGWFWSAAAFKDFLGLETAVPLRVDHGPLISHRGVIMNVGTVRHFAEISSPVRGLLVLAEVDHSEGWGDSLLVDIGSILSQRWLPAAWGMSIGAHVTEDTVLPYEVSVTRNPAFEDALVLGVGADALATWEILTEAASDIPGPGAASGMD
jgi:hypothetical protein